MKKDSESCLFSYAEPYPLGLRNRQHHTSLSLPSMPASSIPSPHQLRHHAAASRARFDAGVELVPADATEREYRDRRLLADGGEGGDAERDSARLACGSEDGTERRVVCAKGGGFGKLGGGVRRCANELHSILAAA